MWRRLLLLLLLRGERRGTEGEEICLYVSVELLESLISTESWLNCLLLFVCWSLLIA